ncbi:MAG: hypothetical protein CL528_06200 [Aequorivita sp.]|nr:hypothetical protein [Aequorivita sp.]MBP41346.1 hypothetical protein [Aequorivita sp.]HBC03000.1 hypothetical protein [Aequorivita sp.]|tara:strand:- start:8032 stop:8232 length:201 start_codon:yes stop_codon:yes gene_type:complete
MIVSVLKITFLKDTLKFHKNQFHQNKKRSLLQPIIVGRKNLPTMTGDSVPLFLIQETRAKNREGFF